MNREHDNPAKQEFSDEFLNAFLDNQLTLEEKDRAYLRISQDETLNRRVCELRKIQDMVRLSYQNSPPPPARPVPASGHGRHRLGLGPARAGVPSGSRTVGWHSALDPVDGYTDRTAHARQSLGCGGRASHGNTRDRRGERDAFRSDDRGSTGGNRAASRC